MLGRLPIQFQACEEPHSLELRLFLQCQEYSWSLSQAVRNRWNGQNELHKNKDTGDKRGAGALNMQLIHFSLCQL